MKKIKKSLPYILVILWFVLIGLAALLIEGCNSKPKIEPGDKVVKCVIDSMSMEGPHSTIEVNNQYHYYTNCGERVTTNRDDVYHIGDTITYVYKKLK
jgi:hypothetical protein